MKFHFVISLILISFCAVAQDLPVDTLTSQGREKAQSVKHKLDSMKSGLRSGVDPAKLGAGTLQIPGDSAARAAVLKANAVKDNFEKDIDSLQTEYKKTFLSIDAKQQAIQNKIDSLTTLHLPTDGPSALVGVLHQQAR